VDVKTDKKARMRRLAWVLLAGLLLTAGLSLLLSRFQALAQPAVRITAAHLEVRKDVNTALAAPGDTLVYTIAVENSGDEPADAWLTDTLPAELTYITDTLHLFGPGSAGFADGVITWTATMAGFGQRAIITFSAQISSEITYAEVVNTAQVTGTGELIEDAATTLVVAQVGNLDNSWTKKTVTSDLAEPGDVLTYTIQIYNDGDFPVPETWLTDALPAELTYIPGSLDVSPPLGSAGFANGVITWTHDVGVGQLVQLRFSAQISPDLPYDGWITNTAEIVAPFQSFTRSVGTYVHRRYGHLEASKSVYPDSARPGEYLTYTVYITNTGDGPVETAWMTDVLPSEVNYAAGLDATTGSWGVVGDVITWTGSLAPSEAAIVTFVAQIESTLDENTRFTNTAEITGTGALVLAAAPAEAVTRFVWYFPVFFHNYPPAPVLDPIPTPVNRSYTVSWQDVGVPVDYYVLQQARTSDFSTVEQSWTTQQTSQYIQDAYCAYYYRVRADKASDWGQGPWSNVEQGQASPPDPPDLNDIPTPGAGLSYNISWSASSLPVDRYVLQESTDADFTTVTREWQTTDTSQQVQNCSSYGTFYYRVRADDDDCWGQGPWSNVKSVNVSPPTLVLNDIPDPDENNSYTVSWSEASIPVDQYVLQESTDADFTTITQEWQTTGTSQVIQKVSSYGTFYYRVRADDDDCWGQGPWSNVESVTVLFNYFDDFSDINSGWPSLVGKTRWAFYEVDPDPPDPGDGSPRPTDGNGYFIARRSSPSPPYAQFGPGVAIPSANYEIEVDARWWDAAYFATYQIFFGADSSFENYYALQVRINDSVTPYICSYSLVKRVGGVTTYLQGWVDSSDIHCEKRRFSTAYWNHWKIRRENKWITVYVNGVELGSWKDSTFGANRYFGVGCTLYEGFTPSKPEYDNWSVVVLP